MDRFTDFSSSADTDCSWYDRNEQLASGWEPSSHADVRWSLRRSVGTGENATEVQRKDFTNRARSDGRPATGLAFADDAYWRTADSGWTCVLSVRRANLTVDVFLAGERHPAADCEQEAARIAEAALGAVPATPA
ncbi:hypothetical protein [Kitasatospora sp. NPDC088134]|uniref:hypothetical protein n=1 Tax=Kitasatospora sp. NPDC088134 TaxID=3364071 RepID=UPI0037FCF35D